MADTNHRTVNGAGYRSNAAKQCDQLRLEPISGPRTLTPEQLDDREAAQLAQAFLAANSGLAGAGPAIDDTCRQLLRRLRETQARIAELRRYTCFRAIHVAAAMRALVVDERTKGRPDRLRRVFPSWVPLVVLFLSALFDATFVGKMAQRVLGVGSGDWVYWGAYLIGVGLSICLYVSGIMLARTLRGPDGLAGIGARIRLAGAVVAALAVLIMLGLVAYIAAASGSQQFQDLGDLKWAFIALLVFLGLAVISTEVLAHDPHADADRHTRRLRKAVLKELGKLEASARTALDGYVESWLLLDRMVGTARSQAHHVVEQACVEIMEERSRRGARGGLELPLAHLQWPRERAPAGDRPRLDLELVTSPADTFRLSDPRDLADELAEEIAKATAQFG
ncbi:hypothetical protein Aple_055240 [Acrocarpospora pleiomorpha]|uniref:Uncharacterized protein n=1 Tax=Acrocarpospora pleiomorpha TaxID=90975 RepID=A0A5M3XPG5_9ACTN|nr:hypothetical protein [Acrocarpospora pleiomorpha]GES22626.1 hypothetical protein Aple_055240 [Acrocarpospora pleiomorpha]